MAFERFYEIVGKQFEEDKQKKLKQQRTWTMFSLRLVQAEAAKVQAEAATAKAAAAARAASHVAVVMTTKHSMRSNKKKGKKTEVQTQEVLDLTAMLSAAGVAARVPVAPVQATSVLAALAQARLTEEDAALQDKVDQNTPAYKRSIHQFTTALRWMISEEAETDIDFAFLAMKKKLRFRRISKEVESAAMQANYRPDDAVDIDTRPASLVRHWNFVLLAKFLHSIVQDHDAEKTSYAYHLYMERCVEYETWLRYKVAGVPHNEASPIVGKLMKCIHAKLEEWRDMYKPVEQRKCRPDLTVWGKEASDPVAYFEAQWEACMKPWVNKIFCKPLWECKNYRALKPVMRNTKNDPPDALNY
jgi:hypothetical protein